MTTYLITGANRGIGRGLADLILARPGNTVVALLRDPSHETSQSLGPIAEGTKVIKMKYDAADEAGLKTSIQELQTKHGIDSLDVVIANAGASTWRGKSLEIPPAAVHEQITINTIGPLLLFAATLPLLEKAEDSPKFIAISSAIGSIESIPNYPRANVVGYGMSKAALNYVVRKLHFDHPNICIELMTPGAVLTDLMRLVPNYKETMKNLPHLVPFDESVSGLMKNIDNATRDKTSGGFRDWKGETVPW